jgi:hypothetical protein
MSIGKLSEKKSRVRKKFQGKIKIRIFQKKVGRATFGSKLDFRPPGKVKKMAFFGVFVFPYQRLIKIPKLQIFFILVGLVIKKMPIFSIFLHFFAIFRGGQKTGIFSMIFSIFPGKVKISNFPEKTIFEPLTCPGSKMAFPESFNKSFNKIVKSNVDHFFGHFGRSVFLTGSEADIASDDLRPSRCFFPRQNGK